MVSTHTLHVVEVADAATWTNGCCQLVQMLSHRFYFTYRIYHRRNVVVIEQLLMQLMVIQRRLNSLQQL